MPDCRCADATFLWGGDAEDYADAHLVRHDVVPDSREVIYRCPATGIRWVAEFKAEGAGGQRYRLRRILRAAELVELLAGADDAAAALDWSHPRIEFRPSGCEDTYHGAAEAQRWAERAAADPDFPRATAISVVDVSDDEAVVLGNVAYRRDGRFVEHRPAAWLITLRHGRIVRNLWFDSWSAARTAAGLPAAGGKPSRRIGRRFLFAIGRLRGAGSAPRPARA